MTNKKNLIILIMALLLAFILVACGGATEEPTDAAPVETEEGAEPVEPGEEGPVTLVFWSMWNENEAQAQVIQGWIEEFEAEHSNITIDAVWNGRQNQTLVRTALSAGEAIDLMDQDADPLAGGLMNEGLGLPLDGYLSTPALDEDTAVADVFVPGVLDLFKGQDGNTYLWPYVYNTVQFWYNKDMFTEVGVEAPETYEEWMDVNQALLDAGYAPIAAESDIAFYQIDFLTYYVERVKGPGFLKATVEDTSGEMWNDPVYLEAAQAMRELWDKGYIPEETVGYLWPAGQQTLGFGEAGAELVGSWLPIELADMADFEWGAFNYPSIEGGQGTNNDLQVALLAFMIMKDSQHPDEAFEFLNFIMTKGNMQKMADEALVGVTRKDVQWADAIADGAEAAATAENVMGLSDGTVALYPEFVNNILYLNWRNLFLDEITPEGYVAKMASDAAAYWESGEVPVVEEEEEEEAFVITDEPVTLTYWSMWNEDEPQGQVVKNAIEAFEAAHPNVTVEITWYGRDIRNLLGPALEAGETIDVYDLWAGGKDNAVDLADYLDVPALDEGYVDSDMSVAESILPALWESVDTQNPDGDVVGVPYNPFVVMVFYNKDHFEEAGITSAPQTWDEFIAASESLQAAGYAPFTEDIDAYMDIIIGAYTERAMTCEGIIDVVNDHSGEAWNNPVLLQMAEDMYAYSDYLAVGTDGNLYPAGQQRVALGEVTMNLNGSWLPSELLDLAGPDFNWGVFSFPNLPYGAGSNTHVESGSQAMSINKTSENPDVGFELLRYISSFDAQVAMVTDGNSPAARVDVPWLGALNDAYEVFKAADQSIQWACGLWDTGEVFSNVIMPNFTDIFLGNVTPEEFIAKISTEQAEFWATHE
ncbi:MAG: extracellular solute-binding protein [Chloroflexota bacterium]|nr:extracellular solute-binding protein [Chloroflexota bacterium]